jgi:hypothetical protein
MMAWSALAGAARIALGGPQDPVRVEGIVTYTGPLPDPIPITEAGTVRKLIEIEPKTKGLKDAVDNRKAGSAQRVKLMAEAHHMAKLVGPGWMPCRSLLGDPTMPARYGEPGPAASSFNRTAGGEIAQEMVKQCWAAAVTRSLSECPGEY